PRALLGVEPSQCLLASRRRYGHADLLAVWWVRRHGEGRRLYLSHPAVEYDERDKRAPASSATMGTLEPDLQGHRSWSMALVLQRVVRKRGGYHSTTHASAELHSGPFPPDRSESPRLAEFSVISLPQEEYR